AEEGIRNLYEYIKNMCDELFTNNEDYNFEWELKYPLRIDNLPIANSAIIVEKFQEKKINVRNTLVGTTYLDFIKEGSSISLKIKPHKKHIPKSTLSFSLLPTYRRIYIAGSISIAHIESGEERLVPNEKSKVEIMDVSLDYGKWKLEHIEEFFANVVNSFLYNVEKEIDERESSFSNILNV
ncbi:MAG: hypothetical protein ACOCV8_05945, partial [Spirochaetota bacterium]